MLEIPLQDRFRETRIFGARIMVASVFIGIVIVVLLGRLIYLQAINHQHFVSRSLANRITPLPIPPVRGLIIDRNGVVLAQNYPVFTLEINSRERYSYKTLDIDYDITERNGGYRTTTKLAIIGVFSSSCRF